MLNLVQLQDRLRDVPMQALMQYANGSNPQIPPFLALTELNRRKKMQEGAAAEQAKEMEGAPTVKEQIEQAAGLIALQGNRQQQASRQQAGIQAAMPMAAPNTTTSEPAQLAGGGFIDDIVVPRDFQMGGGVMNPEMLKRMMMMRKMKPRVPPGLTGIPLPKDMFKRSDYANGGIVAFDAGGTVKRVSGKTLEEYLASVTATLDSMKNLTEGEKQHRIELARQQFLTSPPDTVNQPEYPDEAQRGMRTAPPSMRGTQRPAPDIGEFEVSPGRTRTGAGASGISALRRALQLDPEKYFKTGEDKTIDQIMAEQKRLQGLAGISEEFLDARDRRLAELQSKREAARAQQPMDQLSEFLGGIAEARGGNIFTQGAKGARASRALRAQQEALRDKQDADMEELKFASEAKRDAIRRGDLGEAQKQKVKEDELKRDMLKNQADLIRGQAQLETQANQVAAYMQQATRPTDYERQRASYLRHAQETGEKPTEAGFQRFILGGKASMVMTREDAIARAIQSLGPGATEQEIENRANYLLRINAGTSPTSAAIPSNIKVTREK